MSTYQDPYAQQRKRFVADIEVRRSRAQGLMRDVLRYIAEFAARYVRNETDQAFWTRLANDTYEHLGQFATRISPPLRGLDDTLQSAAMAWERRGAPRETGMIKFARA